MSLDRNAKRAVAALVAIIVALLAMTAWKSVITLTPESAVAAPTAETEDEIIQIGNHTLLLDHGSTADRIAHWLHAGMRDSRAFELGNGSFAAHGDTLSPVGVQRVGMIAGMMAQVKALHARIFLESNVTEPEIEERRAMRIRGTLVADGVSASRIAVSDNPIDLGDGSPKASEVVVVLTA